MTGLEIKMRNRIYSVIITALLIAVAATSSNAAAANEREVRGVVERVFQQLKSGQYSALYDSLPTNSQRRVSRDRFTEMLQRTRDMYELDRMDIGGVRTSGGFAVVDTVMYGRVRKPVESDGKIVAQQYLIREDGRWRVATGDTATVRQFLKANPGFAKNFAIRQPHVFIKRDGRWVDVSTLVKSAARKRA
jgi:hypothetical protein